MKKIAEAFRDGLIEGLKEKEKYANQKVINELEYVVMVLKTKGILDLAKGFEARIYKLKQEV